MDIRKHGVTTVNPAIPLNCLVEQPAPLLSNRVMLGFFQVEEGLNRLGSQSVVLLILANEDSLRVAERRCLGRKTRPRAITKQEYNRDFATVR